MDLGNHILAVDEDGRALRRAQGHVQHGALLRGVDLVPAEHGVNPRPQARFLGKFDKQLDRFSGDAVLGIVENETGGLDGHLLRALRVIRKELPQMQFANLLVMRLETFPCLALGERSDALAFCACYGRCRHVSDSFHPLTTGFAKGIAGGFSGPPPLSARRSWK